MITNFIMTCCKMVLGAILLVFMIILWALLLWFTTAVAVVEYLEGKISTLMNKCYGKL